MDILSLLACFQPLVASTAMRHFSIIVPALLRMTGRVTMLGISRWTEKGGSYRTIQRFYFRGVKYAAEAIKILLEKPETIMMKEAIEEVKERISKLGSIHQTKTANSTA